MTQRERIFDREHIPFELPPDVELPVRDVEDEPRRPMDTITPSERRAFKNIFLEIADRGETPVTSAGTSKGRADETSGTSRFLASLMEKQRNEANGSFNINVIMQNAAESAKQARPAAIPGLDPLSPVESMYSAADREQALLKFPASLRQAARIAYGVMGGDPTTTIRVEDGPRAQLATALPDQLQDPVDIAGTHSEISKRIKMQTDQRAERLRIRERMLASETDTQLWDVMENEVFALVKRLGLETELQPKAIKPKRGGKKAKGEEQSNPQQPRLLNPEVYGPIYPMLLFEGLHLLNTKFLRPSPYIFHILPRVKDLGLMSYVLGVSTSFYNHLMSIMWERYGDVAGVLNTMEEMRHAGLYFDQQTQTMLRNIDAVYQKAERGEQGTFLKKLMGMPEFEPILLQRLNHWQNQVTQSIKSQMLALR